MNWQNILHWPRYYIPELLRRVPFDYCHPFPGETLNIIPQKQAGTYWIIPTQCCETKCVLVLLLNPKRNPWTMTKICLDAFRTGQTKSQWTYSKLKRANEGRNEKRKPSTAHKPRICPCAFGHSSILGRQRGRSEHSNIIPAFGPMKNNSPTTRI